MKNVCFLLSVFLTFPIFANAADVNCAGLVNNKIEFEFDREVRNEKNFIGQLVWETYQCVIQKRENVRDARAEFRDFHAASETSAYVRDSIHFLTYWVGEVLSANGEAGGNYRIRVTESLGDFGVGTGRMGGILANFDSLFSVSVNDTVTAGSVRGTITVTFEGVESELPQD